MTAKKGSRGPPRKAYLGQLSGNHSVQNSPKLDNATDLPQIAFLSDSAFLVTWESESDKKVAESVRKGWQQLKQSELPGVTGLVPGFASLAVHFDPRQACVQDLQMAISGALSTQAATSVPKPRHIRIPVNFDSSVALDLPEVSRISGLPEQKCIRLLCSAVYTVRMLGFSPGFPYLSGLPDVLAIPRKSTPRLQVAAGSVAIAGGMAGIYPRESPGGWNLVGRTTVSLFDPARLNPCLLEPGDEVVFVNDVTQQLGARSSV